MGEKGNGPSVALIGNTSLLAVVLQGGAFLLLAYVVIYIYPQMRADDRAERDAREALHTKLIVMLQDKFKDRNDAIISVVDRNYELMHKIEDTQIRILVDFERQRPVKEAVKEAAVKIPWHLYFHVVR